MLSKDRVKYYTELPSQPFETGKSVFMYEVRQMAAELLSLREQLAELKALEPVGYVGNSDLYALSTGTLGCIAPYNAFEGIPLFTAAKPAGLDVEDITEFMRKAFWRGFESARGTGNSNIPEHWKDSKPNLLLALKAKISGA
ncbi:hypothetical protein OU748_001114 [Yersinia enterocolitica]|nr:hypothetical protein [Yersinia enterocolitica]EKN3794815.1 hypothetical protein [Yersinia enterocolitica]EKN3876016.1 hypothetical protein [Yersinia enterocolitica]EKN4173544.1 hypothetical protein [Yersinia enterocolitica]ELY5227095.1 hypothetical protein [Yersinia enterocolitica]